MKNLFVLILVLAQFAIYAGSIQVIDRPDIVSFAKTSIPNVGYLRKERNGFVYLQVSNDFIKKLLPMLNEPEAKIPPYFGKNGVGTHVSIIRTFEIKNPLKIRIENLGRQIPFEVTNLCTVIPDRWPGCKKLWILQISCPELEAIRSQLGFSPKIAGHEFHITIGIETEKDAPIPVLQG